MIIARRTQRIELGEYKGLNWQYLHTGCPGALPSPHRWGLWGLRSSIPALAAGKSREQPGIVAAVLPGCSVPQRTQPILFKASITSPNSEMFLEKLGSKVVRTPGPSGCSPSRVGPTLSLPSPRSPPLSPLAAPGPLHAEPSWRDPCAVQGSETEILDCN